MRIHKSQIPYVLLSNLIQAHVGIIINGFLIDPHMLREIHRIYF